jgi:type II secretory pathway predicted ATPase ExeA
MYTDFYGLAEKPFVLSADPRFFFLAASHRQALEQLLAHVLNPEGVAVVLGAEGTGKTALCRTLLERAPADVQRIFLFEPGQDERALLRAILRQLGGDCAGQSVAELLDGICGELRARAEQGRRALLLIDDAHSLSIAALEAICELCGRVSSVRDREQAALG